MYLYVKESVCVYWDVDYLYTQSQVKDLSALLETEMDLSNSTSTKPWGHFLCPCSSALL